MYIFYELVCVVAVGDYFSYQSVAELSNAPPGQRFNCCDHDIHDILLFICVNKMSYSLQFTSNFISYLLSFYSSIDVDLFSDFAAYMLGLILVRLGLSAAAARADWYLVGANVFKVTQWVIKTTLHDTEVLVQFVHDVRAVSVQLAGVRLLPRGTLDCQRRPQLLGLKQYGTDPQRPF